MTRPEPRSACAGCRHGFTFVEILAAMLFMAIVIPVTFEAVQLSNRVATAAGHKRTAAQLANRVLTEALVTESWRAGDASGDFTDEQPGYKWDVTSGDWDEDTMRVVTARVHYTVQGSEYEVELSSLAPSEESTE